MRYENFAAHGRKRRAPLFETLNLDARESFRVFAYTRAAYPFVWHHHPELELTLIVRGRGLRFVGDSVEPFREGDLVFLAPYVPHTWYSEEPKNNAYKSVHWELRDGPVQAVGIQFLEDCWGEALWDTPEAKSVKGLFDRARQGLQFSGAVRKTVEAGMLEVLDTPAGSFKRVTKMLELLALLAQARTFRTLSTFKETPRGHLPAQENLARVLQRLHAPGENAPTQVEAAKLAGLSSAAFCRFFKRHMGKTYVEYLNEVRIGHACRLLIETEMSVTEIAYNAGFENLSNFNRRFLRLKKMNPRKYRTLNAAA
jgi:AraC-like DNA-binding protein